MGRSTRQPSALRAVITRADGPPLSQEGLLEDGRRRDLSGVNRLLAKPDLQRSHRLNNLALDC